MTSTIQPDHVLRKAYQAFNDRDRAQLLALLADDVTWESTGQGPTAGTSKGPDEVWQRALAPLWDVPVVLEADGFVTTDRQAASSVDLVFSLGDGEQRFPLVEIVAVRDGRIVRRQAFLDDQAAFDDFVARAAEAIAAGRS